MGKNDKINSLLIPNVSKLPKAKKANVKGQLNGASPDEFKNLVKEKMEEPKVGHGINLSMHAARRMQERNIDIDGEEYFKIKQAMDKLKQKGGKDSLVITPSAAYILDVDKNTIVTAIDKDQLQENVFTKIDSTILVN